MSVDPLDSSSFTCRLCQKTDTWFVDIFDASETDGVLVCEILRELILIEVDENDGLPTTACHECWKKLGEFQDFKTMCIKSAEDLKRKKLMEPEPCQPERCRVKEESMEFEEDEEDVDNPLAVEEANLGSVEAVAEQGSLRDDVDPFGQNPLKSEKCRGADVSSEDVDKAVIQNEKDSEDLLLLEDLTTEKVAIPNPMSAEDTGVTEMDEIDVTEWNPKKEEQEDFTFEDENIHCEDEHSENMDENASNRTFELEAADVSDEGRVTKEEEENDLTFDDGLVPIENEDSHKMEDSVLYPSKSFERRGEKGSIWRDETTVVNILEPEVLPYDDSLDDVPLAERLNLVGDGGIQGKNSAAVEFFNGDSVHTLVLHNTLKEHNVHATDNGAPLSGGLVSSEGAKVSESRLGRKTLLVVLERLDEDALKKSISPVTSQQGRWTEAVDELRGDLDKEPLKMVCSNVKNMGAERNQFCDLPEYACSSCSFKCHDVIEFRAHKSCHNVHERKIKGKIPDSKNSRKGSSMKQKFGGLKAFKCDTCAKVFTRRRNLALHLAIHAGLVPFKCEICAKVCSQKCHFEQHLATHSGLKPFRCETCGKNFTTKSNLMQHSYVHSGVKRFMCEECGKKFAHKRTLLQHSSVHNGLKPFSCEMCRKRFVRKTTLQQHLTIHTGIRQFKCDTCGKKFARKFTLVQHIATHDGLKPFHCDACGKRFAQKSNFVQHLAIHNGWKPFQCDTCGKHFSLKSTLLKHLTVHTGLKPFNCEMCGKEFSQKSNMVKHLTVHSEQKPSK